MSLSQAERSTRTSPAGAPVFMSNRRMTATLGSFADVPPSRSATYNRPLAMSLPYGSFSTSGGVRLPRAVVVEERDPGVVRLHGLRHAAVGHHDDPSCGVVRTTLRGIDRAVHFDVRGDRLERSVSSRIDGQAEAIAYEEGLWLRLPCE